MASPWQRCSAHVGDSEKVRYKENTYIGRPLVICWAFRLFLHSRFSMLLSHKHHVNVNRKLNLKFVVICWRGLRELLRLSVVLDDCLQDSYCCFLWTMGFCKGSITLEKCTVGLFLSWLFSSSCLSSNLLIWRGSLLWVEMRILRKIRPVVWTFWGKDHPWTSSESH